MKTKLLITCALLVCITTANAQKIKYKDLFPILDAKNWEEGGPTLRTFLADPKNVDFPNANLQMGIMLEERFSSFDIVADSVNAYSSGDSAIAFYQRSIELINEKELKKNDEYYQAFFRRDLRTGEFGIKVSDVHLDLEKKIEGIEQKIGDARLLQKYLRGVRRDYGKAVEQYKVLVADFQTYSTLLLAAGNEEMEKIQSINDLCASALEGASEIQKLARSLGSDKYQGEIILVEIKEFGKDGMAEVVAEEFVIELWNYQEWAANARSEINGSIGLLKTMITNHSKAIRGQRKVIMSGTDSVVDTLSQDLLDLFAKYDPESIAKRLLQVETSEVLIRKQVDISINPALQDSSLIGSQLEIFSAALKEAERMSFNVESITEDELTLAKRTYKDYIDSFFQPYTTASNFAKDSKDWVNRQKEWLGDAVEYWSERNSWGIDEDEDEKIPLSVQESPESTFFTIGMPVKTNEEAIVYGANMIAKKGYVYSFGPDRISTWKLGFDLPGKGSFKLKTDTIPTVEGSFGFYLLNEAEDKNNLSLTSFTMAGTLNWSTVVTVPKEPVAFKLDDITQELTILLYPEDQLPLSSDNPGYIVIDRTGNAR